MAQSKPYPALRTGWALVLAMLVAGRPAPRTSARGRCMKPVGARLAACDATSAATRSDADGPVPYYGYCHLDSLTKRAILTQFRACSLGQEGYQHAMGGYLPYLVQGQVEGSVYMAIGEGLMEEQVFRKGVPKIP